MQVNQLTKRYDTAAFFSKHKQSTLALNQVSFHVKEGETLGIVGESGCGKSTLGKSLMRLTEPTSGSIQLKRQEITLLKERDMRSLRKDIQMIFQDPYASLNPRMKIKDILEEPLIVHQHGTKAERRKRVKEMLHIVGFDPSYGERYAHQFSGGQRQRIGIARALITHPSLVIADEPVSALDVSVQAQILNLMLELQKTLSLTYLFISHDLGVVRYMSDRIAVMYAGRIVEMGPAEEVFHSSLHPYTSLLLKSIPHMDHVLEAQDVAAEETTMTERGGCPFYKRCPKRWEKCLKAVPSLYEEAPGHAAACYLYQKEEHNEEDMVIQ
ncbi:ABC transporter ATP-binding protein [Bacillus safensis]|uniref:ABC transporter ATP-binding protein n=1 Tax=Bacillus safensis TaxID=561879 RepID=UPI002281C65C|nr:ABC transporter ATP-binding protein [Bacillus safensis]MCY7706517.1 ABC transporter ATP-binding protein [Bacillus safensis]MCY7721208.1 ABC transporter ATP-binding protein [Bacillus safensis]MED0729070.1 ABC transporter ATP-binding protein [Bacillus safensis]